MRNTLLGCALAAALVAALPGAAPTRIALAENPQPPPAWQADLKKILDPLELDAPADRLGAARTLLEEHLKKAEDPGLRLELGMVLAAQAPEAAYAAVTPLVGHTDAGIMCAARTLAYVARLETEKAKLAGKTGDEAVKALQAALKPDQEKLMEALGTPQAARNAVVTVSGAVEKLARLKELGRAPKPFEAKDLAGAPISLDAFKGKVVLVDFWATWCFPCTKAMPSLIAMHKELAPKGFEIVGVSLDKDREKLERYLEKAQIPWTQSFDGLGWESPIAKGWGVQSVPATVLIDRDGLVRFVNVHGPELRAAVEKLLERKASGS